jgi:sigma-B regulation protein RsbU (phosphoserine phosphatase)
MTSGQLINDISLSHKELNAIYKITESINNNVSVSDLVSQFKSFLESELKITRIALVNNEYGNWESLIAEGINFYKFNKLNFQKISRDFENESILKFDEDHSLDIFSYIIPIKHKKNNLAILFIGDDKVHLGEERPSIKHLEFIKTYAHVIFVAIENKRLYKENVQKERFKSELSLAKKMNRMLIKENSDLPSNDFIDFYAFYKPLFDIGGDFYDAYHLNEEETGFCIADVSGKGVSAAILMSNIQASLNALFFDDISLSKLVTRLNKRISQITKSDKFITLFVAKYNSKTKELAYINAGHNAPVLYHSNENKTELLDKGCLGIGMVEDMGEVEEIKVKLTKHSKMICFTDGISESNTKMNIEFSHSNFTPFLNKGDSIETTVCNILEYFYDLVPKENVFDDSTILGVEFK